MMSAARRSSRGSICLCIRCVTPEPNRCSEYEPSRSVQRRVCELRPHCVRVCFRCEVCGFQCRQRASLKYHMTKHKAEADLEFACVICGKRFEKAHNLNVHMSMVHPLLQGGSGSVPADSSVSSTPAAQHEQTRADSHPSDISCVLDSLQSKLADRTV